MTILQNTLNLRNKKINKLEKLKSIQTPMDFINKFKDFCNKPYSDIQDNEVKYLLKCFGFYDKGEDNFMLRLRIPAGQLNTIQAIKIGEISKKYGKNYLDITTRQQLEFRFLKQKDLIKVLDELNEVNISTFQTGIDNLRNITTSSFDGLLEDSHIITTKPIIDELQSLFFKKEEYFGVLPRKINTAILGSSINDCNVYGQDIAFVISKRFKEIGFNLFLGGKVGIQAYDTGLFIKKEQVTTVFKTIIEIFKKYGFRDNRNKNRIHYLIQAVGLKNFVSIIEEESKLTLKSSGELLATKDLIMDETAIVSLKDNKSSILFPVPSGIFTGSALIEAAYIAQKINGEIRLTVEQSFFIVCKNEDISYVKDSPLYKKYGQFQNPYFINQIACAGTLTCPFGVIENKSDAIEMAYFLNEEVPLSDAKVRMYWSACVKGCGIHGCADIGFEGCKVKDANGESIGGVKILIGGKVTKEVKEARVLHKGLTLLYAQYFVKELMNIYKNNKKDNESFEAFDTRVFSCLSTDEICQEIFSKLEEERIGA